MLLQLDLQSEVPIYTQIVNGIVEGIARRQLLPGQSLPSVRNLASDLGINLHTVNKAYQILRQDGYVQINRKQGVVIGPEGLMLADAAYLLRLQASLKPLVAEAICRRLSLEQLQQETADIYRDMKGEHADE